MKYNVAVVVGRFQPYHNTHHKLLNYALSLGDKVLILLGSAKTAPDVKNPFTPKQREEMIRACFDKETNDRLLFFGVRDYPYNENNWMAEVQNIVREVQEDLIDLPEEADSNHNIELGKIKTCLVGHFKDASSYYLKMFPQWTFEAFYDGSKESKALNATDIRSIYLGQEEDAVSKITSLVPTPVLDNLLQFAYTETYKNLAEEYKYLEQYKADSKYVGLSYPTTFNTTDVVLVVKGHLLVVRRGMNPGKGLLALPGGFLASNLTLKENALKELKEETRIHVPVALLESSIKKQHTFDYPQRSQRGRTITHAFYIELNPKMEDGLPLVKGGDDAAKAFWMPLASLGENEDKFFEDHAEIVRFMTGVN